MFFGRVQWAKADSYSLIRTRTANLRVHWVEDIMPPDVYVGKTVCGAGKIKTWDGGRYWSVIEAVPLTEGQAAMQRYMELIDQTMADPLEWCPDLLERKIARRRR